MEKWINDIRSGDPDNVEAKAAAYYWKHVFEEIPDFTRGREGEAPVIDRVVDPILQYIAPLGLSIYIIE